MRRLALGRRLCHSPCLPASLGRQNRGTKQSPYRALPQARLEPHGLCSVPSRCSSNFVCSALSREIPTNVCRRGTRCSPLPNAAPRRPRPKPKVAVGMVFLDLLAGCRIPFWNPQSEILIWLRFQIPVYPADLTRRPDPADSITYNQRN